MLGLDLGDGIEPVWTWEIIIGDDQIEAIAAIRGNVDGLSAIADGKASALAD
ncbi:MAG: hypothetical protein WCD20_07055 [Rhodomicrobium sp.]